MAIAKLSLAVNRRWTGEDGQTREEVTYVDIDAFGKQAEVISQYLRKGGGLLVEGRLKLDQWDDKQTGQKRSKWQLVADEIAVCTKVIESLERKRRPEGEGQQQRGNNSRPTQRSGSGSRPASRQPVAASSGGEDW